MYEDAIQAYRQALILNAGSSLAADNLLDARERVNAQLRRIMEQERRVDEDPSDTSRYGHLANLFIAMRQYDQALPVANQMLVLDPEDRTVYDTLAAVYEAMGDPDQAGDAYERIVSMAPDDAEAWEHLGTWRSLQGETEEAIRAYEQAVQLDPSRYTARFSLAEAYLELARYDHAVNPYQALVKFENNLNHNA